MRLLLHTTTPSEQNKLASHGQGLEHEELSASCAFVESLLEESLAKLEKEELDSDNFVRWELGACWIQHLQDQKNADKDKKPLGEKAKNEMKVEGLGTPLRSLKNTKKKSDGANIKVQSDSSKSHADSIVGEVENAVSPVESKVETSAKENELVLTEMLSDAAFARLKESETGLHCKVIHYRYH